MSRTSKYYTPRPRKTPEERFWSKVDKSGDCWIWTGYRNLSDYGTFWFDEKTQKAHRVSWQFENGAIPAWAYVLHKCDVPACVNPDHLFLGTAMDNSHDMLSKGRARWQCEQG